MPESEGQTEEQSDFEQLQIQLQTDTPITPKKPKPTGLLKLLTRGVVSKILLSIAISMVGGAITHSAAFFGIVTTVCAAVGVLGGEDAKEVKKSLTDLLHKAKDAGTLGQKNSSGEDDEDRPTLKERIVGKVRGKAVEAVKDKVEDIKEEATEKVEAVKEQAEEKVEAVKEEVKDTVTGAVEKIGNVGRSVGGRVAEGASSVKERLAEAARTAAQQQPQQGHYNARCTYCKSPMRVPERASGPYHCHTCGASVMAGMARAAMRGRR